MIENLTSEEIEEILKDNVWGHLGCNDGFNTYVYPLYVRHFYTIKLLFAQFQNTDIRH